MSLPPLLTLKILAAIAILLIALLAALLPLRFARSHRRILTIGDAFASGVFLSAALFHMLPAAEAGFRATLPAISFPYANLLCAIAFVIILFLERGVGHFHHTHDAASDSARMPVTPYVLVLVLSIHALIEGIALGINATVTSALIIFSAIVAHKGSESFALA